MVHVRTRKASLVLLGLLLSLRLAAGQAGPDSIDSDALGRLREQALEGPRSKVMEIASALTDLYGPRLTGSPNLARAGDWAMKTMTSWGLTNVHRETFPFGRGWENARFVATALTPATFTLIGAPKAWTPGTNGPVTAEAVLAVITTDQELEAWRGKLGGKFVLTTKLRDVPAHFEAPGHRFTDAELTDLARPPANNGGGGRGGAPGAAQAQQEFLRKRAQFFAAEGVAALIDPSPAGDGGTVLVQAPPGVSRDPQAPLQAPQVVLAVEHYGRITRLLEQRVPVTLQMDIASRFLDTDLNASNVLGEIAGTDKRDEVVMLGAHLDSWHGGTGATDNAAGSAIVLEAMRILKESRLPLRRTVRVALWAGEEQGLLGSAAYVKEHFADRATMQLKPEHAKLSVYLNVDNGTGLIRGVYLQGNEGIRPIFERWMEPFRSQGMTTLASRGTGGTDHGSFDAVGLPGFQFVQDVVEYDARTHHFSMDLYERLQPNDLMRNAAIVAAFAYQAANRNELLPRKPLPQARN
jgi:hypothetical protein